jgi:hypothetical protein
MRSGGSATPPEHLSSGVRLNPDAIVYGCANPLFATPITPSRLHRQMSRKELDLRLLASRSMAEAIPTVTAV